MKFLCCSGTALLHDQVNCYSMLDNRFVRSQDRVHVGSIVMH